MDDSLVLLNPGPAGTSAGVRKAQLRGDLCHREPEFSTLLTSLRAALARAANLEGTHETILLTGSGTAVMEMAVISSVRRGRSLLVLDNGVYGERLGKIAEAYGITTRYVRPPGELIQRWTTPIDPTAVEAALHRHPDIDVVACVQHETTTGLLNPIAKIGAITRSAGALFLVDAISGIGNENADLAAVDADFICGSANKGLHGQPGLAFLLYSTRAADRIREAPVRSLYLSASSHLDPQRSGTVPFTPAIPACYALDQALIEYSAAGGHPARKQLYQERARLVREGFTALGLSILVAPPHRANSVTTLELPAGTHYQRLHDELKHRGFVIYGGQGVLSDRYFRICTMGEIPWSRLEALHDALSDALYAASH